MIWVLSDFSGNIVASCSSCSGVFSNSSAHYASALTLCVITALIITLLASLGGRLVSVKCISEISFIRRHRIECMMAGFMIYFWTFSLIAGWYKPQFKKEYQTLHYENARYYVLARYDGRLVLSQSYRNGSRKFVIINGGHRLWD